MNETEHDDMIDTTLLQMSLSKLALTEAAYRLALSRNEDERLAREYDLFRVAVTFGKLASELGFYSDSTNELKTD